MIKRYLSLFTVVVIATVLTVLWVQRRLSIKNNTPAQVGVLPKDDKEQIIVDTRHHTLTRITDKGTQVTYLPEKPTVIDLRKSGDTVVHSAQFGFQVRPYAGLAYSDDARGALGLDLVYWKRLNLGIGLQLRFDGRDGRIYTALSYNVVGNVFIAATIDHKKTPGAMLALRF